MQKEIIIELEEKLRQAMLKSDVAVLDELIADSLIFTIPTGETAGKQMDLDAHSSGLQKLSELKSLDQKIQVYDNFAVVIAKVYLEGNFAGQPIDGTYTYTRIWANLQDRWQIVAGHVSRINL